MGRYLLLILTILVSATLTPVVNAIESEEGTKVIELSDFSGGLNNNYNPFRIPKNEGDIVQNIRFDAQYGSLTKRDKTLVYGTASATEPILGMHRLYTTDGNKYLLVNHGDQIDRGNDTTGAFTQFMSLPIGDHKWQWLTWNDRAIGCDGYNNCVKYDGTSVSATYLGTALATISSDSGNPNGSYSYKVACYSASYYAPFNTASNTVVATSDKIELSEIPICPDTILGENITGRKVYRTEAGGTTYKLLSNGAIANNTATTLTDNDADGSLGAAYVATGNEVFTPPKGRVAAVSRDRLWIANNPDNPSRLYYSDVGHYDVFYDDAYFDIRNSDGDQITCLKNVLGILTVCKENSIQKLYNDDLDVDNWTPSDPMSAIGNVAMYSAVNTQYGLFYLGNNGIYLFNGQNSQLISDKVTPVVRDIVPSDLINVWGAYYNNTYSLAYSSNETGASTNNRILTYDLVTKAWNISTLSANVLLTLNSGSDVEILYAGSSNDGKVYSYADSGKSLVHTSQGDFVGTFDDVRYVPVAVGGDLESAEFELAWTSTIDSVSATIDSMSGVVDRPDTDGTYTSPVIALTATTYDKLYWNELLPAAGGDVNFHIRTSTSDTVILTEDWSSEFTNPSGSDISSITPSTYIQYKFDMSTNDITQTPILYEGDNYVVKLTYNLSGSTDETSIPFKWRSGWMDFAPGYKKTLEKFQIYYDWDASNVGTLNATWEDYEGATDLFEINLRDNPTNYSEYFTTGALLGDNFRVTLEENSLFPLKIKKIILIVSVQPLV